MTRQGVTVEGDARVAVIPAPARRLAGHTDHELVAGVHAVEGAEGHGARTPGGGREVVYDLHQSIDERPQPRAVVDRSVDGEELAPEEQAHRVRRAARQPCAVAHGGHLGRRHRRPPA